MPERRRRRGDDGEPAVGAEVDGLYEKLRMASEALHEGIMQARLQARENFRETSQAVQPWTKVDKLLEMKDAFDKLRNASVDPVLALAENINAVLDDVKASVKTFGRLTKVVALVRENKLKDAFKGWCEAVAAARQLVDLRLLEPGFVNLWHKVCANAGRVVIEAWRNAARVRRYKRDIILNRRADAERREKVIKEKEKELGLLNDQLEQLKEKRMREVLQRIIHGDAYKVFSAWRMTSGP